MSDRIRADLFAPQDFASYANSKELCVVRHERSINERESYAMKVNASIRYLCLLLLLVTGCRGCSTSNLAPSPSTNNATVKSVNIEAKEPQSLPAAKESVGLQMKPGHWYQANQQLMTKRSGESLVANAMIHGPDRKPIPMHSGYGASVFRRELDLAPAQAKNIRFQFLQPEIDARFEATVPDVSIAKTAYLSIQLLDRSTGAEVQRDEYPIRFLAGYQYNLVTLNRDPTRYSFWQGLACVAWPSQLYEDRVAPYRVIPLKDDDIAGLFPNRLFSLTSTSHLVFNDASPNLLSIDQQEAVLDWLHFGGTIILNGPDVIAEAEASFLRAYLPLSKTSTVDWTDKESQSLNSHWSIAEATESAVATESAHPFSATKDLYLLVGEMQPQSQWVPKLDGLVAERQIGQGRVVMTTFPMSNQSFLRWRSYDSLIHNGILRKPPRKVIQNPLYDMVYANLQGSERNATFSTRLRLWARDLDSSTAERKDLTGATTGSGESDTLLKSHTLPSGVTGTPGSGPKDSRQSEESETQKRTSFGAWNSESAVSQIARKSLQAESGITVPKTKTILYLLGGYLICLVPINWLVFRLMGRVELAWAAAPIIAVAGAALIARFTQLDIGFTRSQHTYELLECHPNHPRGVLSSYHSLYTSLSTTYKATYDEDRGVVTPLFTARDQNVFRRAGNHRMFEYTYGNPTDNGLQNNVVLSNTTGMLHAEETVDLGGHYFSSIDSDTKKIAFDNNLSFALNDLGIIGRTSSGEIATAWLGDLLPGESEKSDLTLSSFTTGRWLEQWEEKSFLRKPKVIRSDGSKWTEASDGDRGEGTGENQSNRHDQSLYQGAMLELLATGYPLASGEYIGLAWTDHAASQIKISPQSKHSRRASLVLLHITPGELPEDLVPDMNLFPSLAQIESETGKPEVEAPSGM